MSFTVELEILQRLSLELGGVCCLHGCAADQFFYPLICVFMRNHACLRVWEWERPHVCHSYQGIPLEECHNKPKSARTNTASLSYRCRKCQTHLNILDLFGIKCRWGRRTCWTGIKRNTQNTIVTSLLIFSPSAHCVLVGCICVRSEEMHQAFKNRPAGEAQEDSTTHCCYHWRASFFAAATSRLCVLVHSRSQRH